MPRAIIARYTNGETKRLDFNIPQRVTITGEEDHFHRAYEDARMILIGMKALDAALADESDEPVRYWIVSVIMD